MIKIIFSDMDGTLLTSDNKLPENFHETVAELKKRGVIFAPASGRQYFSLLKTFADYKNEFLFLSDNGTLVMQNDKEIFSQPMNISDVNEILEFSKSFENILTVFCGKKNAYILAEQNIPELIASLEMFFTRNVPVNDWSEIDDTPIKISFFDPTGNSDKNVYPKVFEKFGDRLQVVLASGDWTDITAPHASKGRAVENVQKILNIKPEECAAFGDYMNDYDMMNAVGYSFAMANAYPEIKKVAKFETVGNDDFGVIVGIKRLMAEGLI